MYKKSKLTMSIVTLILLLTAFYLTYSNDFKGCSLILNITFLTMCVRLGISEMEIKVLTKTKNN